MKKRISFYKSIFFLILLVCLWISSGITDTYVVTHTDDSGAGSLRQAITDANNHTGPDTIVFNIPEGVDGHDPNSGTWTIQPLTGLPYLNAGGTFIDGTSQAMFIGGDPNNQGPEIVVNGSLLIPGADYGFRIQSSKNGLRALVVNQFFNQQIYISGDSNHVAGCFIGSDASGHNRLENDARGIYIAYCSHNLIGGMNEGDRNVISGNKWTGISMISESSCNRVVGNYIGINSSGTDTLGNIQGVGISFACKHNTIGPSNVISGNTYLGVNIQETDTDSNIVIGNLIGTDPSGTVSWGNGTAGIYICMRSSHNFIGGTLLEDRNIISGNIGDGIYIATDSNTVQGNFIGTDITGSYAIANESAGIKLGYGAESNIIGGPEEGAGNLISGNQSDGIEIMAETSDNNQIEGNIIGADAEGLTAVQNGMWGIYIEGAKNNKVGPDNLIAFNGADGILVWHEQTVGNTITCNSIHSNVEMGIRNDGGNTELEPPLITSLFPVSGTSLPDVKIEIFSGPDEEGKTFEDSVFADASGTFTSSVMPVGPYVTATATDASGNTSEFSDSVMVTHVESVSSDIPVQFSLSQNYPNPFNPETTIKFDVKTPSRVVLKIFNPLGREMAKLVDARYQPGHYQIEFDATGFSSGIYFYQIEIGDFRAVRKMVLLE
jgi:hypothetical protein